MTGAIPVGWGTPQLSWVAMGGTVSDNNILHSLTWVWGHFYLNGEKSKNKVVDLWETNMAAGKMFSWSTLEHPTRVK